MHLFASVCFVFTVSPPSSLVDRTTVPDYTAAEYDNVVKDRPLPSSFQASRAIFLPQISPIFPYFSCPRHCCCYYVKFLFCCIACFCRPLMYPPLSYAAL